MAKSTLLRQYVQDYYKKTSQISPDYDKAYAAYKQSVEQYNNANTLYQAQIDAYKLSQRNPSFGYQIRNIRPDKAQEVLEQNGIHLTAEQTAQWLAQGGNAPPVTKDGPQYTIAKPSESTILATPTPESQAWRTPLTEANIHEVQAPHDDLAATQLAAAKSTGANPTLSAQANESAPLQDLEKLRGGAGAGILQRVLSGQLEQTGTNSQNSASAGTSTALKGIEL